MRKYYLKNREAILAKSREWANRPEIKARKQQLAKLRSQTQEVKLAQREASRRYKERNHEKVTASERSRYHQLREAAKHDPVARAKLAHDKKIDRAYMKEYAKKYYKENKERYSALAKARYAAIKADPILWRKKLDKQIPIVRSWRKKNPEKMKLAAAAWLKSPRGKALSYAAKRRAIKRRPELAMRIRLRSRMRNAMKLQGISNKCDKTVALLGCDPIQFKKHLESLFLPGMSWENRSEWEIDHIRPCSSFNLLESEQQRCCFHFSNMQPLWKADNRKKANKWQA